MTGEGHRERPAGEIFKLRPKGQARVKQAKGRERGRPKALRQARVLNLQAKPCEESRGPSHPTRNLCLSTKHLTHFCPVCHIRIKLGIPIRMFPRVRRRFPPRQSASSGWAQRAFTQKGKQGHSDGPATARIPESGGRTNRSFKFGY